MNREAFIPDIIWINWEGSWMVPLSRLKNPERWLAKVKSDRPVITQIDDGIATYGASRGIFPTSSSSAPGVMVEMLDLLDVRAGMNILEIGTGTGYNAALLAERAEDGRVTTIEIDEDISLHARSALQKVGSTAVVVHGDGTRGYPEHAPYDRLIATAGARTVPFAWIEQTKPGGRILLPLVGSFGQAASGSWASFADDMEDEGYEVLQCGPRRLWSDLEAAYLWWVNAGRPEYTRFGLTVDTKGQRVWLDTPDNVVNVT